MAQFAGVVSVVIFAGVCALAWQLAPQGARGQWRPIVILGLVALSYLSLTPAFEAVFAPIRVNTAYLVSSLCAVTAIVLTMLYWRNYLSADPPTRQRVLAARAVYGSVGVILILLFMTSPQRPHGVGFAREFAGNPRMQLYWAIQALVVIHAMSTLAGVAARASVRERHWRRILLTVLACASVLLVGYETWVLVVVGLWPAMPPLWAQRLTNSLQVAVSVLLAIGTTGPVVLGTFRSARLARSYIERLAPLHRWLTQRYPQVRFRSRVSRRAETRVTDMLIEISDALRLLQRDAPALAACYRLDHESIRAAARDSPRHVAYELTAAKLFEAENLFGPERKPRGRVAGLRRIRSGRGGS
ncbi:DUF6545 domain-containing protein [Nocardia sp. NPDC057455]|uniref:DUF6545 domain-containing protein n=1 Tax=Nocardia sp. NPDC057455 TaxID=3346138 RepID=UPI003672CBC7